MAEQLARRNVDAGEDRRRDLERLLPGGELARRRLDGEDADLDQRVVGVGERIEIGRPQQAQARMAPARQRLEAGDGAVLEPHDRLEHHVDFAAVERVAQIVGERLAVRARRAHAHGESLGSSRRPPSWRWRARSRRRRAGRRPSRAATGSKATTPIETVSATSRSPKLIGGASVGPDATRRSVRARPPPSSNMTMTPNWSPPMRASVSPGLRSRPSATRHGEQRRIAERHAERVVDLLEAVDVDHQRRRASAPPGRAACDASPSPAGRRTIRGWAGR